MKTGLSNDISSGLLRPYGRELSLLNRILDCTLIWFSLQILCAAYNLSHSELYKVVGFLAITIFTISAEWFSVYKSQRLDSYRNIFSKIMNSWLIAILSLMALAFATKTSAEFSRITILSWAILTPIAIFISRYLIYIALRTLRSQGRNLRTFLVFGQLEQGSKIIQKILKASWSGLDCRGCYESIDEVLELTSKEHVDYIFIAVSDKNEKKVIDSIKKLGDRTASVYLVPALFISDSLDLNWGMFNDMPVIGVNDQPFHGSVKFLKRIEDIFFGGLILLLIAPIFPVIALLIMLDSPGPVFFSQKRYGLNGEIINVLKFRTMHVLEDSHTVEQAKKGDVRITRIGKILRSTSLDELPQFINVLRGTMSVVGPRPHAVSHNEYYRKIIDGYMLRHKVKPGITGWAQINGFRGETDALEKMQSRIEFDLHYINHWSIFLDIKIIIMTIFRGFYSKHAY